MSKKGKVCVQQLQEAAKKLKWSDLSQGHLYHGGEATVHVKQWDTVRVDDLAAKFELFFFRHENSTKNVIFKITILKKDIDEKNGKILATDLMLLLGYFALCMIILQYARVDISNSGSPILYLVSNRFLKLGI